MTYTEFEKALSPARLNRYLGAVNGDQNKALELYRLNIQLSQEFYAILSLFEVSFRNAIDIHYQTQFSDSEWLKNQCTGTGFLNNPAFAVGRHKSKKKVNDGIKKLGVKYNHDRLVASISFGFWINLFAPMQFRYAGQTLHRIFVNRQKGTQPKDIFKVLSLILDFRNRVAHHEPLCFNSNHQKDVFYAQKHYNLILEKTSWLGHPPQDLFKGLDNTQHVINQIAAL